MKKNIRQIVRWPTVCTKCGSLEHLAKDCNMHEFGVTYCEHEQAAEDRRDRRTMWAFLAALLVGHMLVSWLTGGEL